MHPLAPSNFGPNGLAVTYNNGTTVTTGYILRQIGTHKFVVSDTSGNKSTITLINSTNPTSNMLPNTGTIPVKNSSGGVEYAYTIMSKKVITTSGNLYTWSETGSVSGAAVLANPANTIISSGSGSITSAQLVSQYIAA